MYLYLGWNLLEVKMNAFAWRKRWANREKGTGYKSDRTD